MKKYYLTRQNDTEAYSVFETENELVQKVYPHTQDSVSFTVLEELILSNDPCIVYCDSDTTNALSWKTPVTLPTDYQYKRAAEYPPITEYLDGVVKGDQAQIQAYIDACLAVKAKYPKSE